MTALLTALGSGVSAKKILDFLMKKSPELAPKINKALAAGLTAEKVVEFFTKGNNFDKLKQEMEKDYSTESNANPLVQAENVRDKNLGNDAASTLKRNVGPAIGTLASVGGAYALSRAIPSMLQPAVQAATSQTTQAGIPPQTPLIPNTSQPPVNPVSSTNSPQGQPNAANIPQTQAAIQPQVNPINASQIIEKYPGLKGKIQDLLSSGNGPEEIEAYFTKFNPSQTAKLEKEIGKPFKEIIQEIIRDDVMNPPGSLPKGKKEITSKPLSENLKYNLGDKVINKWGEEGTISKIDDKTFEMKGEKFTYSGPISSINEQIKEKVDESPKIEKASTVISPNGIGEVKEIRNGQAIVEVDGKKHKVSETELETQPKGIDELYDDLLNAIPEEHKSRMMNYAGYDEENNELLFRPHGGAAYVYKDIPSEFAEALKSRLHKAKTTGSNMYGMWHEGDQSYGAGMSKLIKELQAQYGGKGKEYVRKYNTLFDILGIPHEEKKRREKERREEEKRRKRNG